MYASSGKTSNRKNDILENPHVNNKIPTTNSKSPINLSTNNICFCNFLIIVTDCEINKADSKNGTPRPNAYNANREVPFRTEPSLAAKARIAPSCGPIQGVQPKANANPKT